MTAELKRYDLFATGPDYDAFFSDIVETPEGKYVRFADVEAYTQAAIAAKNAQIIDLIEALRGRTDGEICGCGVDNPTDVCLSHYDVIEAVVRNRVQAAIAAAMMGAYKEGWSDGAANCHHDRNETPDDGWLISDTYKSIPTDATAAAIRAMEGGA